jgi:hypothetical protein
MNVAWMIKKRKADPVLREAIVHLRQMKKQVITVFDKQFTHILEEQAMMRQMGLPVLFGETKIKREKHSNMRTDLDEFSKLVGFHIRLYA